MILPRLATPLLLAGLAACGAPIPGVAAVPDLVVRGGRVLDPETGYDAIADVAIRDGRIVAIGRGLSGARFLDATDRVVAPGFIDALAADLGAEAAEYRIFDGVTTALAMEGGPVDTARTARRLASEGRPHHFGMVVGHGALREAAGILDPRAPATESETRTMERLATRSFLEGALGIGFGLQYTPGASHEEVIRLFELAGLYDLSCHVHLRFVDLRPPDDVWRALNEVVAAAALGGTRARVIHVTSVAPFVTPRVLELLARARRTGVDVDADFYPYGAWMTALESPIFDPGWRERERLDYGDLEWLATGERLGPESFERLRAEGGLVIAHGIPEEAIVAAARSPIATVASDGGVVAGKDHPRGAGTFARWVGRMSLRQGLVPLREALGKVTFLAADRLANTAPDFRDKGRLQVGRDADLVVFDPRRLRDRATFGETRRSEGVVHLIVGGVAVIEDGARVPGARPGQWIVGRHGR